MWVKTNLIAQANCEILSLINQLKSFIRINYKYFERIVINSPLKINALI